MNSELKNQISEMLMRGCSDYEVHVWLCHPNQHCKDGCEIEADPERLAAYDEACYWALDY